MLHRSAKIFAKFLSIRIKPKWTNYFEKYILSNTPPAQFDPRVPHTYKYAQNDGNDLPYTSMYGIRGMRASNEVEILNEQC